MRAGHRPAFTLFQLLSLLALLGLLFALLLPAVAKVRHSAARSQSQNNLKQLALACHNYHDTFLAFPPGNDKNDFSAAARLLPFIEQNNVYKTIDFTKPVTDKANEPARKIQMKIFLSPLDPQPADGGDGPTNYLFNAGPGFTLTPKKDGLLGPFYQDSKVSLSQITNADGASLTFMIGETLRGDGGTKAVDVQRQYVLLGKDALAGLNDESGVQDFKDGKHIAGDRGFRWIDGRFLEGTFTGTRVPNDPRPDVSAAGAGGLSALRSMDASVNVAFCDGSVRVFSKKITLKVWKDLSSWNDGNAIPPADLP